MLETIISEVLQKKDKLFLTFKDLGSVYVNWQHVFPSKILSKKEAINLEQSLYKSKIYDQIRFRRLEFPFNIIQIEAPINLKKQLPKNFILGHYKEQMWNYFAIPGSVAYINEDLHSVLVNKKKFEKELTNIKEEIREFLPDSSKGYQSKVFNKLNQFYFNKEIEEIANNSDTKKLTENILNLREKAQETFSQLEIIANSCNIDIDYNKKTNTLDLTLHSTEEINVRGPLNYEEVLRQKWLFLDIEIPHFDREKPEISWVGLSYYQNGQLKKEIHTLSSFKKSEINNYKMNSYNSESDLVEAVKNSILNENPYYISAYNANFDLIKLREAEFKIGERDSNPVKEVSTKFFERIGIYGKEVIDLLRWAQTCFDYLPNQKLETIAREIFGSDNFTKSISYKEMADLEEISRSENSNSNKAAEKISSYLAADVNVMVDFFESKQFKSFLNDMCDFSKSFNIPLSQLIYSPKKIQSSQNIVYFNETGIYYNQVYRKDKKSQDKRQKKKNSFNRRLNNFFDRNNKIGLFENVHQCYLPYGFFLRKIISKKLSPSESLFSIKSNDNQRRFYLSKFANTLSERILIDYEDYHFKKNSNEDEVILRKARNKIKGKYNTTVEEIQENMNKMKELIENWIKENNLKLIHQEGSYLYIQGGNEETYLRSNKAPVVNVSSLEKILLTKGKPNGKIYFQKGEILNGMKISSQPTYFHNIFEMETYGHFLNQLLSGNIREALNELYFSCDSLLSAKIEPKKLFWKNKSADFYSAFSKGSKINFSSKYEGEIKSDINGNYVESNGNRIYLLNQNQIQIDWDKYITRNEEKLKEFLFPLIGESYLKFTRPIEEVGTIKEKEFDNMESEINFNLKKMLLV